MDHTIFDLSFSIAFILQKSLHPISLGFSMQHPKYYGRFSHKENLPEEIIEHVPVHATYGTHKQAKERSSTVKNQALFDRSRLDFS